MNTPVSFPLAKLLKEKGFIERAEKRYGTKSGILYNDAVINDLEDDVFIAAPTISDVVMWIYNKNGIWISPYQYRDHAADANDVFVFRTHQTGMQEFKSPSKAYEAAIEVTLNKFDSIK